MDGWSNILKNQNLMWYICKNKKNELFTMPQKARELLMKCVNFDQEQMPSEVVKEFNSLEEVEKFYDEMNLVDRVIENVLKN